MNFKIEITGLKEYQQSLSVLVRHKVPMAVADALNHTVSGARIALQNEMDVVFKPKTTPYLKRGVRTGTADKRNLSASVYISAVEPGKRGLSPSQILWPQIFGGQREVKASEHRLRGWQGGNALLPGQYLRPGHAAPLDAYGNISSGSMRRILGYIEAFRERGYNKEKRNEDYYVVPGVGVFKHVGKSSVAILWFIRPPQYQKRFHFYQVFQKHIEKTWVRNLVQAWGSVMFKSGFTGR